VRGEDAIDAAFHRRAIISHARCLWSPGMPVSGTRSAKTRSVRDFRTTRRRPI
jgi:hypothetical protein